jgi:hypothetical protein
MVPLCAEAGAYHATVKPNDKALKIWMHQMSFGEGIVVVVFRWRRTPPWGGVLSQLVCDFLHPAITHIAFQRASLACPQPQGRQ